jgi:hypothetical protein
MGGGEDMVGERGAEGRRRYLPVDRIVPIADTVVVRADREPAEPG